MTSYGMSHEAAREALAALALDALDPAERDAVQGHVPQCAECRAELASLREAASELTYGVAPVPMPEVHRNRVRSRLVARAGAEGAPASPIVDRPPVALHRHTGEHRHSDLAHGEAVDRAPARLTPASLQIMIPHASQPPQLSFWQRAVRSPAWWVAIAASIVAVSSLYSLLKVSTQRDTLTDAYQMAASDKATRRSVVDSLRLVVEDRDRVIANLTGPQVALVTLTAAGARVPAARMFWNQPVNAWTFIAHNLPAPKAGRTYQLWLVTATEKISAGTFTPSVNGDAIVHATYVLPKDALAAVAVTDEPAAGSPQPTTVPFIVGSNSGR
ncbi:MAG: hypothetical protein JWM95_2399 [Gemmatimonadetes bacterium]|nr:hypothetical protein [Gemmatimonadota bacterium]